MMPLLLATLFSAQLQLQWSQGSRQVSAARLLADGDAAGISVSISNWCSDKPAPGHAQAATQMGQ